MSWRRLLLCLATFPQIAANFIEAVEVTTRTQTTTQAWCSIFGCRDVNFDLECQCDAKCEDRGDCCSDYKAVCLPQTHSASCADYGCGAYAAHQECQCNVRCPLHDNCCSDYQAACSHGTPEVNSSKGSCDTFGCHRVYSPYNSCQCNSECVQEQTCCSDFEDVCGGNASNASSDEPVKTGSGVDWALCNAHFEPPSLADAVVELNGVQLPDTCIRSKGKHIVFIIGDWGGLYDPKQGPVPADHRKEGVHKRDFVDGLDDRAQQRVAEQMIKGAERLHPDYIINVGDNFYWGGVEQPCCATRLENMDNFSAQWDDVFERIYTGGGIDGLQWLGVLGNHDYGGFLYGNAWDQAILYTWKERAGGKPSRWVTPALYWRSTVHYVDFSVEYFFLDTNIYDAWEPFTKMNSNICSFAHNPHKFGETDCSAEGGPAGTRDCKAWFDQLWLEQLEWLHLHLSNSSADWQIVVTHFPPNYDPVLFRSLSDDYGIDAFLTGHLHRQEVHGDDDTNFLAPTVWVVSGGGGGITSDYAPHLAGDSQYGYMSMTLSKDKIEIVNIDHAGNEGDRAVAFPRHCKNCSMEHVQRNRQLYEDGIEARGRLVDRTVTTTTFAQAMFAQSAPTSTTTSTIPAAAQEAPFDWRVVVLFSTIGAVALLGGATIMLSKSLVDKPRWPGYDGLRRRPASAKQSLITQGWAQTELPAMDANDFY